jgi:exodeoxyribonuclease VII small subunit
MIINDEHSDKVHDDEMDKKQNHNSKVELNFESALEKLETHVRTLEQGDLNLEESLSIFEEGMKLARFCTKKLDEAEQKIQILVEKDGGLLKEDFELEK